MKTEHSTQSTDIDTLIHQALAGSKPALEAIIKAIQDDVFYLALRMLANPENAREATQDILIKVMTKLSSFRFESQFKTWVYALASNHLISEKKLRDRELTLTFEDYSADLESDLQSPASLRERPDYQTLLNELRISCTIAMLLCLKPTLRIAYILGEILQLDHSEASEILTITKVNFRKQLSRAREMVTTFTKRNCSLVSQQAQCSCEKKLTGAINRQRVRPDNIFFDTGSKNSYQQLKNALSDTQQALKTVNLQSDITHYKSIDDFSLILDDIVEEYSGKNHSLLQ